MRDFSAPAPIAIFCTVAPTKRNGLRRPDTHRVANCKTEAEIAGIIERDKRAMSDSFGGLVDAPGVSGRTYRAFRAEWTEIKVG